jgi:hypothetical protein
MSGATSICEVKDQLVALRLEQAQLTHDDAEVRANLASEQRSRVDIERAANVERVIASTRTQQSNASFGQAPLDLGCASAGWGHE